MQHLIATGDAVAYDLPIGVKVNAFRAVTDLPTAVAVDPESPAIARIRAARLAAAVYFVRLETREFTTTSKLILVP